MATSEKKVRKPKFDPAAPYGEIFGSGSNESASAGARYVQCGHYFRGDHTYLRSEPDAEFVAHVEPVVPETDPGTRQVGDEDLAALETNERGQLLIKLPLDRLATMVKVAGGPAYSGDNAIKLNAAWLLKYTDTQRE